MAHEKFGDTPEELEGVERMLEKRIAELDGKRAMLVEELRMVREKKDRLAKGGA
jgi:hypothetical protein